MDGNEPALQALIDQVGRARGERRGLVIRGGGTKAFYGEPSTGEALETLDATVLTGTPAYEPTELVVTTRCGTSLSELEALLANEGQCLPFEPPRFGAASTVGGMIAAGLSGPSRAAVGSVRDHVLGATILDGRGEVLSFGGQVIKNVAGYDVSRLMVGALGTLGLVLEVSLKVLALPRASRTLRFELDQAAALERLHGWGGLPLPLDASAWWDGNLLVRLRGAEAAVSSAVIRLGGEAVEDGAAAAFWTGLRDHADDYFVRARQVAERGGALWRLGVPQTAPPLDLAGETLLEWHGAQRWLIGSLPAADVRAAAAAVGGHATRFYGAGGAGGSRIFEGVFTPLASPLDRIHLGLKRSFDPDGIFNPGRLCAGL